MFAKLSVMIICEHFNTVVEIRNGYKQKLKEDEIYQYAGMLDAIHQVCHSQNKAKLMKRHRRRFAAYKMRRKQGPTFWMGCWAFLPLGYEWHGVLKQSEGKVKNR